MTRVFLADDHALFRDGMRRILEASGLSVVGEAGDVESAVTGILEAMPDVAFLDLAMPGNGGGRAVLQRVKAALPEVRVIVLSTYAEDTYAAWLLKAGASAYLTKGRSSEELLAAVREVAAGRPYVTESLAPHVASDSPAADLAPHERLSPRQREVFRLLVEGRTPSEVGHALDLTPSTVSTYIARIRTELGVESVPELLVYAARHGLV